jgi:hypothetical protein
VIVARRVAVAACVALAAGWYAWLIAVTHPQGFLTDFDQTHRAAQILWARGDPYAVIGVTEPWPFRYFYPLTAAVAALPLGWFGLVEARVIFVSASAFLFAFAVTREKWWPLLVVASGAFVWSVRLVQWNPLLVAAAVYPWLGWAVSCKPNVGAISLAAIRDRTQLARTLAVATAFLLLSLIPDPRWPVKWLDALSHSTHFAPMVMRPWGWLLLLAAVRWRDPEARVLLALSLVPLTQGTRDWLVYAAVTQHPVPLLIVTIGSHLADLPLRAHPVGIDAITTAAAQGVFLWLSLPMLAWVLVKPHASGHPPEAE